MAMLSLLLLTSAYTYMGARRVQYTQVIKGDPCWKFHEAGAIRRHGLMDALGLRKEKCRCLKELDQVLSSKCGTLAGQYTFDPTHPDMTLEGCACVKESIMTVRAMHNKRASMFNPDSIFINSCVGSFGPDDTLTPIDKHPPQGQLYRNYRARCNPHVMDGTTPYTLLESDDEVRQEVAACENQTRPGCKAYVRAAVVYPNTHGIIEISLCGATGPPSECKAFPLGLIGEGADRGNIGYTWKKYDEPEVRHIFSDAKMIWEYSKTYQANYPQLRSMSSPMEISPKHVNTLINWIANGHHSGWNFALLGSASFFWKYLDPRAPAYSEIGRQHVCRTPIDQRDNEGNYIYRNPASGVQPKYNCVSWVLTIINCFFNDLKHAELPELRLRVSVNKGHGDLQQHSFWLPTKFVWDTQEDMDIDTSGDILVSDLAERIED